jgi:hypothetical protein
MGSTLCEVCLQKIPEPHRTSLLQLRPGDGLASAAAIAQREAGRARLWRR